MEKMRRQQLEDVQYEKLFAISDFIDHHDSPTIENMELQLLGVLQSANLDVDDRFPCDFEPRFFRPYDKESGLEEKARRLRTVWKETLDADKITNPEYTLYLSTDEIELVLSMLSNFTVRQRGKP